MKKILSVAYRLRNLLTNLFNPLFNYFKQGIYSREFPLYFKNFITKHLQGLTNSLKNEIQQTEGIHSERIKKLRSTCLGLHSLLPFESYYSYSILIAIESLSSPHLLLAIESALAQTAPQLEILVGCFEKDLEKLRLLLKNVPSITLIGLKVKDEVSMLNEMATQSKGYYLLLLSVNDWIRPDYLFRCEQFLRLQKASPNVCLYTDEYLINEKNYPIPGGAWHKKSINFPYVFQNEIGKSLLIPKSLWMSVGGINYSPDSEGFWELSFKMYEKEKCIFCHLPFPLYARRLPLNRPLSDSASLIEIFQTSFKDWQWSQGLLPSSLRAIPPISNSPSVQVIIPFKEQKKLTLAAVRSVFKQKGVRICLTCVDNGSLDQSIGKEIEELGGEVLLINEPFNYSRLNNLAVQNTTQTICDFILFLNNDVELNEHAVEEMCRWGAQPELGMIGAWLSYPNGLLQHGGVDLIQEGPGHQVIWNHTEKLHDESKLVRSKQLHIVDAVTAACALVKRSLFIEVGGFDELCYPIAYSDTNLAVKIANKGFKNFYTPYARGVHHESVSRKLESLEDVESSRWLHNLNQ